MSTESASALTDILLAAGTLALGTTVGQIKTYRSWMAFFMTLAFASGMGAIYHGGDRFHTHEFWVLVSTSATAASFLFLSACLVIAKPQWTWLHWLWPAFGIAGLLLGGLLAPFPFYYISWVALLCIVGSLAILARSPSSRSVKWIYSGMALSALGFVVQKATHMEGLMGPNSLFHLLLLAGNACLWKGARQA